MQTITRKKRLFGLFCSLLATVFWACNYPVTRLLFNVEGGADLDEWWASWLRLALGIIVLLPITCMLREGSWGDLRKQWRQDWKLFFFLSACTVAECVLCFVATKYTTGARASLMSNTSPVFTLIISVLAAREILTRRKVVGILMGLAGIILVSCSKGGDMFSAGASMFWGDFLALVSGIFWALFTVFGGNVASRYNGIFCTTLYRIGGIFLMLPVMLLAGSRITFDLPLSVWIGLLYLAVVSSGIAVWLWSIGQKYVEPAVQGAFGYLGAIFAAAFSLIFLKEKITLSFVLSFCLILAGMALLIRRKRS